MLITHLIIIVKLEVSTFLIVVTFSVAVYVWGGCTIIVPSYAVGSIYILGKLGFTSFITVQCYDVRKQFVVGFDHGLPCRVKNMARGTQ